VRFLRRDLRAVDGIPIVVEALTAQPHGQRKYFDAEFQRYETYKVENWRRSFIQCILPAIGVPRFRAAYLDVGVGGSGATVIEATRLGAQAVGCDLSLSGIRSACRFAREQGVANRTEFVVCAAERLPFEDATFGCASAVTVLEHLDDDASAARELARVVRPGHAFGSPFRTGSDICRPCLPALLVERPPNRP
jgi:ubiquinone/menaquinone biosynthesis C-methylase UbiE